MMNDGYCIRCECSLGTGDTNGLCFSCRELEKSKFITKKVIYVDKIKEIINSFPIDGLVATHSWMPDMVNRANLLKAIDKELSE